MFVINRPKEGLVGEQQRKTDASESEIFGVLFLSLISISSVQKIFSFTETHFNQSCLVSTSTPIYKEGCSVINY